MVQRRRLRILLAALRRFVRMESFPIWTMVFRSISGWLDIYRNPAVGLAALSLRQLDFPSRPRLGLDADRLVPVHPNRLLWPNPGNCVEAGVSYVGPKRFATRALSNLPLTYLPTKTPTFV